MHTPQPAQPSVLDDPAFRRPRLPGAHRPIDLVLSVVAFTGMALALAQSLGGITRGDPSWIESADLRPVAREAARGQEQLSWVVAYAAIGLLGAVALISRLLYRVHRCELLLRWSGIDESRLQGDPSASGREPAS